MSSLGYIWWGSARPSVMGSNLSQSWQVGPLAAPTIYAFTSMQSLETQVFTSGGAAPPSGYHDIAVYSGISSYVKGGVNVNVGQGRKYGVVPGIWESDVSAVTFAWGLSAPGGRSSATWFQ
jgi:hypothetical protein